MADVSEIQIEGKSYSIDNFELGELEWLEEELGCTLDEVNPSSMKAAVRFIYLIKHRDDESYTLEDARKEKVKILSDEPPAAKRPTRAAKPKAAA